MTLKIYHKGRQVYRCPFKRWETEALRLKYVKSGVLNPELTGQSGPQSHVVWIVCLPIGPEI